MCTYWAGQEGGERQVLPEVPVRLDIAAKNKHEQREFQSSTNCQKCTIYGSQRVTDAPANLLRLGPGARTQGEMLLSRLS